MSESTHFIGIGGTGLSAIARVLVERGEHVTGSDREESPLATLLRQSGVKVSIGHAAANINGATRVVRSSAVGDDNVEVQAARAKGIPVYKRADFLGPLLADQQVIAVAGSHGKTTTTAMIAWMLTALNQRPGYIIGSISANLGTNAAAGSGRYFVIEADEYDRMFLGLNPKIAVVTNVEHDHPDMFPTAEDFYQAFEQFVSQIDPDGALIACGDDIGAVRLLNSSACKAARKISYGSYGQDFKNIAPFLTNEQRQTGIENAWWAARPLLTFMDKDTVMNKSRGFSFDVSKNHKPFAHLDLQVHGYHNQLNAMAALAVADELGLSIDEASKALADFRGTDRRLQIRGKAAGVTVIDDYAHHPTEIRKTLATIELMYQDDFLTGSRFYVVWQPHTFSRTARFQQDYLTAFHGANALFVMDVYASREKRPNSFDLGNLVQQIKISTVRFTPTFTDVKADLMPLLQPGDVVVVLSAGDAINLSAEIFEDLQHKEERNA